MARVIADERRTALHVVALPEELPVNEAFELLDEVKSTRVVPPGALVLNRLLPRLFGESDARALEKARAHPEPPVDARTHLLHALLDVGERRRVREQQEHEQELRLQRSDLPLVTLPLLMTERLKRADVERFAAEQFGGKA
jgi:anion-transporting  ArsA/GET3 family ATPase